ncbi:MAG TPA: glycosyltransferase family 4 protein [Gemmatimonadaceae bacterium]|nr:glycosyltransferase family 4 protein [Gemmatimonadaceae bacterium]
MTKRLGILATHPIQYYAPLYRMLAGQTDLTVYFAYIPTPEQQGVGFGVPFTWDTDLMGGYDHVVLGEGEGDIAHEIRRRRFDAFLVHGWNARCYWEAIRACWATGTPVCVRGDSQLSDDRSPLKRAVKRLTYPRFMGRFAACLAVGTRSEAYFRYYGARRIFRSPHFVDNPAFAAGAERARGDRAARRAAWSLPPHSMVALYVGKLVEKKRPLDLIDAVSRGSGAHALFVGDGPLRGEAERAAAGQPVTFAGFRNQSEMPEAYAVADVLVLPSDRRETWGLAVNEAMACGLPAIVSDAVGCAPDLIVEGVTGSTYPAGNCSALADALARLTMDPPRTHAMGVAAAAHVAGYSVECAAHGVRQAMEAVP